MRTSIIILLALLVTSCSDDFSVGTDTDGNVGFRWTCPKDDDGGQPESCTFKDCASTPVPGTCVLVSCEADVHVAPDITYDCESGEPFPGH